MKKMMKKRLSNEKGLTLVELLAVIVILGIIAAIAIPSIGGIINNSKVGAFKSDILNAVSAAELYVIDNPTATTVTFDNIKGGANNEKYIEDIGSLKEFSYVVADKKITAKAEDAKITVAAVGASKKNLIDLPNNTTGLKDNVTVTRK